jgi:PKD repeat protein
MFLLLALMCKWSQAQFNNKETKIWYFGNNAGLDFNTTPPTILTNGAMSTIEGCATISDVTGSLLFYTDGIKVYTASHTVMPNGNGLMGNSSSSQSAIIAKQPGASSIYYIFTNSGPYGGGMGYSIVDMSLASGQGSVTTKNFTLQTSSTEKLTSVKHCNGIDIWVIMHKWNSDQFCAYLLTAAGLNSVAVTSTIGTVHTADPSFAGCMKTSPNGKKLGLSLLSIGNFELFDFDNSTGAITNSVVLASGIPAAYGCEFSPDGTKFYGSTGYVPGKLYQWDLCAGSNSAIAGSSVTLFTSTAGIAAMQNAADGKIYIARFNQDYLGVINNPNALGMACNYVDLGQSIQPKSTIWSIPNFICNFKKGVPPFTYTLTCNTSSFTAPVIQSSAGCAATSTVTGIKWNFGDPSSAFNTSTLSSPSHAYNSAGTYTTKMMVEYDCGATDTVLQVLQVNAIAPSLSVSGVFTVCSNEKHTYTVSGASTYTWTSLHLTPTLQITTPSSSTTLNYSVSGTNSVNGCTSTKTFTVVVSKCTALNEYQPELEIRLYPVPVIGLLNIDLQHPATISIMNLTGSALLQVEVPSGASEVDLSSIPGGLYIIEARFDKGVARSRFIKTTE